MDFVTSATDPWGRPVLTHVSWQALWVSILVGITFLLTHAAYMVLSANQKHVGPKDIPDFRAELLREVGYDVSGPKPGKYPLGNRLYHLVLVFVGLTVISTGVLMLPRIDTPILGRNPYLLTEATWGYVYVIHGLVGVSLIGLTAAPS